MRIVCPHCTTSYAIDLSSLGAAGRAVRCSRCKEVWQARPEDAVEAGAPVVAMADAGEPAGSRQAVAGWDVDSDNRDRQDIPVVESPSISGDWGAAANGDDVISDPDWPSVAQSEMRDGTATRPRRLPSLRNLLKLPALSGAPGKSFVNLPTACAAMGALVLALTIWRVDVVRLLPQTAAFYKMVGLDVNIRNLLFKDVKITNETVDGKPVLVIEGVIVGEGRQPIELPRLRFSVRDAQGAEIYAWNAVLEQPVLKPGERAWFKSRLASPPPEARNLDIRFFSKRDIAAGNV